MAYSALYRKFRPEKFSEIIGQPHITRVLLNQVRSGRVAHAYLFSGSRGTGKTSTARILAKAINCLDPIDGEPCGKCAACSAENNVDIIEMDAASNSRVEEMRALIERAEFAPLSLKTKVYIIDEAHMLTKNASNALLKTLEEPPAHVVFILATTEPQMLPATIVSRCQRFEFHRLRVPEMVDSMKRSLESIGAHIDDDGLIAIARAAEGGMRDCLSIADQCLSFCGGSVSADDVASVLGSVDSRFLIKTADAVIASDAPALMRCVGDVVRSGRDLGVFALDLAAHFRALLLVKLCGDCRDILDCTDETMADYKAQAERISNERATRAVEELLKLQFDLKLVSTPRTLLESTLLRICRPDDDGTLLAVSDRISSLENELKNISSEAKAAAEAAVSRAVEKRANEPVGGETSACREGEAAAAEEENCVFVPDATPDGDDLYARFIGALKEEDQTIYFSVLASAAHWVQNKVLHICFDRSGVNTYNYICDPASRQTIRRCSEGSIAPYTVEFELRQNGSVKQNTVTELFGVPIVDEN